jgi:XTP/dITP diphosphohydrolase
MGLLVPVEAGLQACWQMRLLLATTNRDKLAEIASILAGLPLELVTLASWPDLAAPVEDGETFQDNARAKALYYAATSGLMTAAEDSGFEIDALGGAPGVQSARAPGRDYPDRMARLYEALDAGGSRQSAARFVCAVAIAIGSRVLFEALGKVEGEVAPEPRGANGFGYDPMFFYPPYRRTFGQLTPAEKAAVSHRGQAFREVRAWLERELVT